MKRTTPVRRFAICLNNRHYPISLEQWKIYRVLPDAEGAAHEQVRVVDESGEDYLYPAAYFRPISLPPAVARLHGRKAENKPKRR